MYPAQISIKVILINLKQLQTFVPIATLGFLRRALFPGVSSEVGCLNLFIGGKVTSVAVQYQLPGFQNITPIGNGQCHVCILFDEQNRRTTFANFLDSANTF
jgi:hypothetical protein